MARCGALAVAAAVAVACPSLALPSPSPSPLVPRPAEPRRHGGSDGASLQNIFMIVVDDLRPQTKS